jgi:hypothetical protein
MEMADKDDASSPEEQMNNVDENAPPVQDDIIVLDTFDMDGLLFANTIRGLLSCFSCGREQQERPPIQQPWDVGRRHSCQENPQKQVIVAPAKAHHPGNRQ